MSRSEMSCSVNLLLLCWNFMSSCKKIIFIKVFFMEKNISRPLSPEFDFVLRQQIYFPWQLIQLYFNALTKCVLRGPVRYWFRYLSAGRFPVLKITSHCKKHRKYKIANKKIFISWFYSYILLSKWKLRRMYCMQALDKTKESEEQCSGSSFSGFKQ